MIITPDDQGAPPLKYHVEYGIIFCSTFFQKGRLEASMVADSLRKAKNMTTSITQWAGLNLSSMETALRIETMMFLTSPSFVLE